MVNNAIFSSGLCSPIISAGTSFMNRIKVGGLGGTAQFLCGSAMEKDCTLKVERPVYDQEDLHKTYGYAKPTYTGECHFLIIRPRFGGEPEGKNHFEGLGVDGWVIPKLFLNKQNESAWTGLIWFRIGTSDGLFRTPQVFFFFLSYAS